MTSIKRRHFLQFAGSTLASLGLSQFDFLQQAHQFDRVLAQSTPRKLALLIGINNYPAEIGELQGCLNDVELQRQLLIHRYGFKREDILEISDNVTTKPTRANILQAFEQHLIRQARQGDVVVVHFSGHGSLVKDPNRLDTAECRRTRNCDLNGTMVPLDGTVMGQRGSELAVPDIMGRHLFLLMRAINTDYLTVVLDCCHSGAGTRGNANVRAARPRARSGQILISTEAELEAQAQLRSMLKLSAEDFQKLRQQGIARGVALGSARRDELAVDAQFDGFHAGGFTYLLTRYLWQQANQHSAETVYVNLQRSTDRLAAQQRNETSQVPVFEYLPNSNNQDKPLYFTPLTSPPAEAAITKVGQEIEFWLGGVSVQNLQGSGAGTVFTLLDETGQEIGEIEQTRRAGLYGYGKLVQGQPDAVKGDRLLREKIVGIPTNPKLKIGLDRSLGTDLNQATTELGNVSSVQPVEVNSAMDYLLGRMTQDYRQQLTARGATNLSAVGTMGLFTPDLSALLPNTFGPIDEPVITAINRLRPRFRALLADQILSQLLSSGRGSPLKVTASVTPINREGVTLPGARLNLASRGAVENNRRTAISLTPPQFREDTLLKVEVNNQEREDLYVGVLVISADGVMDVLYPSDFEASEEAAQLAPAGSLSIPGPRARYAFAVQGTSGFPELLVLASREPLRNTLRTLKIIAGSRGHTRGQPLGGLRGNEALDVINSLLGDLTNLTRSPQPNGTVRVTNFGDAVPYDKATMAVLAGVFEAIPKV
jgi:hypothetical protein